MAGFLPVFIWCSKVHVPPTITPCHRSYANELSEQNRKHFSGDVGPSAQLPLLK